MPCVLTKHFVILYVLSNDCTVVGLYLDYVVT